MTTPPSTTGKIIPRHITTNSLSLLTEVYDQLVKTQNALRVTVESQARIIERYWQMNNALQAANTELTDRIGLMANQIIDYSYKYDMAPSPVVTPTKPVHRPDTVEPPPAPRHVASRSHPHRHGKCQRVVDFPDDAED